jgi:uncharacterized damage-inducible protein DinB
MQPDATPLSTFYPGWATYQDALVHAVAPLSSEQLALRAAPSLRTVWELAAHIIATRVGWFHLTLAEGGPALAPFAHWDLASAPPRESGELVEGLDASWSLVQTGLERWTPPMLADRFTTPRGRVLSRGAVLWHVLEHDLHHGGELSLTLGLHGLPAVAL